MKLLSLILATSIIACSKHDGPEATFNMTAELESKFNTYMELSTALTAKDEGWIHPDNCDSLEYSALYGSIAGVTTNIELAIESPGKWLRRPLSYGDCFKQNKSKSQISKDMLLGLYYFMWQHSRGDLVKDLIAYGESHNWIMGESESKEIEVSRSTLSYSMRATLYELDYSINGTDHNERYNPIFTPVIFGTERGFEAQLAILHANLYSEIKGEMRDDLLSGIKDHRNRESKNALFHAVAARWDDGNQETAISLLLDQTYFPNDALPTNAQMCDFWLWSTESSTPNWSACPETKQFTGADFLFVASMILY